MNPVTYGWVLYRVVGGEPQFMGIYQTREKAEAEVAALDGINHAGDWKVAGLPFIGWGAVGPGVFSQNGKPSLKLVE